MGKDVMDQKLGDSIQSFNHLLTINQGTSRMYINLVYKCLVSIGVLNKTA